MTLSNADLIERFLNGGESGSSSRMEIQVIDGVRCIVGYGWAVYAADLGNKVALFGDGYATDGDDVGWAGYGPGTTTGHLQMVKGALESRDRPFLVADVQLRTSGRARSGARPRIDRLDASLGDFVREHEVEPRGTTGPGYSPPA